jgi:hypothetical protein
MFPTVHPGAANDCHSLPILTAAYGASIFAGLGVIVMTDRDSNEGGIRQHPLVEALVPDPAQGVPQTTVLQGYVGNSTSADRRRLYLTEQLDQWVELPVAEILYTRELPDDQGTLVWVRKDLQLDYQTSAAQPIEAQFLSGQIIQRRLRPGGAVIPPLGVARFLPPTDIPIRCPTEVPIRCPTEFGPRCPTTTTPTDCLPCGTATPTDCLPCGTTTRTDCLPCTTVTVTDCLPCASTITRTDCLPCPTEFGPRCPTGPIGCPTNILRCQTRPQECL